MHIQHTYGHGIMGDKFEISDQYNKKSERKILEEISHKWNRGLHTNSSDILGAFDLQQLFLP